MCSKELKAFGSRLGLQLVTDKRQFICGGMGGFMEAVCKGIKQSPKTFFGQTIGLLPNKLEEANPYVDIPIATGIGIMRNVMLVQNSDIIIAAGGGAGTLSELASAWQLGKKVLCLTVFDGWARELAGRELDKRHSGLLVPCESIEIMEKALEDL